MRIGVDVKCLRSNNSGIGRYVVGLLRALGRIDSANDYVLFSPRETGLDAPGPRFRQVVFPRGSLWEKAPGILWQQIALPRLLAKETIDVFWGPEQTLPLRCGIPAVLTVHDFVHRRCPETMRASVRWIVRTFGDRSVEKASVVAANSEFTRKELLRFHPGLPAGRIAVVPCGVDAADAAKAPAVPRERRLLFVGSVEPRKNLKNLVAALELLAGRGVRVPLTLAGPAGWKNRETNELLARSAVAEDVRRAGFVDDAELRRLYAGSAALVLPSVYEGFGLPVLEAIREGTPVLTTKGSAMEDVAGKCGIYFDARSPESIAEAIGRFLEAGAPGFSEDQEAERARILERHDWNRSAGILLDLFRKLGSGEAGEAE